MSFVSANVYGLNVKNTRNIAYVKNDNDSVHDIL